MTSDALVPFRQNRSVVGEAVSTPPSISKLHCCEPELRLQVPPVTCTRNALVEMPLLIVVTEAGSPPRTMVPPATPLRVEIACVPEVWLSVKIPAVLLTVSVPLAASILPRVPLVVVLIASVA